MWILIKPSRKSCNIILNSDIVDRLYHNLSPTATATVAPTPVPTDTPVPTVPPRPSDAPAAMPVPLLQASQGRVIYHDARVVAGVAQYPAGAQPWLDLLVQLDGNWYGP